MQTRNSPRLILLGKRRGALQAAGRMGGEVWLLDESLACKESGIKHRTVDFGWPAKDWKKLAAQIGPLPRPTAVAALSERTVVAAACLRQAMGLAGCSPSTARLCRDKALMKARIRQAGIPCARFLTRQEGLDGEGVARLLGLPLVVKPRDSSGGRGMRIVRRLADMPQELPQGWMAESFLEGVEMSVESLLVQGQPAFTNFTEYWVPRWANIVPAQLEAALGQRVSAFNRRVIEALGITSGMTHLEIFLSRGRIIFGEIALRPPGGHLMELIREAYQFDPWQALLEIHLGRPCSVRQEAVQYAGSLIFHPGPGRVMAVEGAEEVRSLPQTRLRLKAKPGDLLPERQGTGQEAAHLIARGSSRQQVVQHFESARRLLRIRMDEDERDEPG